MNIVDLMVAANRDTDVLTKALIPIVCCTALFLILTIGYILTQSYRDNLSNGDR